MLPQPSPMSLGPCLSEVPSVCGSSALCDDNVSVPYAVAPLAHLPHPSKGFRFAHCTELKAPKEHLPNTTPSFARKGSYLYILWPCCQEALRSSCGCGRCPCMSGRCFGHTIGRKIIGRTRAGTSRERRMSWVTSLGGETPEHYLVTILESLNIHMKLHPVTPCLRQHLRHNLPRFQSQTCLLKHPACLPSPRMACLPSPTRLSHLTSKRP